MTRVLVTGASGFVGRSLVPFLSRDHTVRAMVRRRDTAPDLARHAEVVTGDLLDPASLHAACAGVDCVVHLAAVADSSDEDLNHRVNVDGTRSLGEAAVAAGISRFVNVSSTCAGRRLQDAYGRSKRLAEDTLDGDALGVTHLRPAMIYGPGSAEWDLFVRIVGMLPRVPLPGDGRTTLRPVYLEDALLLIGRVLDRDVAVGRTYDVAGPEPVTTAELVERVGRAQGRRRRALPIPAPPMLLMARLLGKVMERPFVNVDQVMAFLQDTEVDIQPARRELGWDPRPLTEGLDAIFGGTP